MDPVVSHPLDEPPATTTDSPVSTIDLRAGAMVFSRFILERPLGQGRCSVTWLADDRRFHGDVALKIFHGGAIESAEQTRSVWQTVLRRLRILNHPNIALPMEFFQDGNWAAVNNTYVEGRTLAEILQSKKDGKLPFSDASPLLVQVGFALASAHSETGVVHGNLNAFNVMVNRDYRVSVTDFGFFPPLSEAFSASGSAELLLKTIATSPERKGDGSPSFSDDIYAFGALCLRTLTGTNPAGNPAADIAALGTVATLPKNWREAILSALAPATVRMPSMQTLLAGLNGGVQQAVAKPAPVRRESGSARLSRNTERWKAVFMVLGVLLLIPVFYLVISQYLKDERELQDARVKEEALQKLERDPEKDNLRELQARLARPLLRGTLPQKAEKSIAAPAITPAAAPVINSQAREMFAEGQASQKAGDNQAALTSYDLATMLEGAWPELLEARASALAALDRTEEALSGYSQVLATSPTRVPTLIARAKLYLTLNRPQQARADLTAALKAAPDSAEARQALDAIPQ